jgi:DNA-binding response OmpR family regulator
MTKRSRPKVLIQRGPEGLAESLDIRKVDVLGPRTSADGLQYIGISLDGLKRAVRMATGTPIEEAPPDTYLWLPHHAEVQEAQEGVYSYFDSRLVLRTDAQQCYLDGNEAPFTRMEYALLEHLATHPDTVFSRHALLQSVWGSEHYEASTVNVHLFRVRAVLDAHGLPGKRIVVTKRGAGILFSSRAEV